MPPDLLDLSEMRRWFDELHPGIPLDEVDRATRVKLLSKIMEICTTPGMLDLIHTYQTTLNEGEEME